MENKPSIPAAGTHPLWNLLFITAPQTVMCIIFIINYNVISSSLSQSSGEVFGNLFYGFLAYQILVAAGSLILWFRKQRGNLSFHIPNIIICLTLLYLFSWSYLTYITNQTRDWMFSILTNYLMVIACSLPAVLLSLYNIIQRSLSGKSSSRVWKNFLPALAIPAGIYILFKLILPALRWHIYNEYFTHVLLIFIILCSLCFYFLLFRGVFILLKRHRQFLEKHRFPWMLTLSLILPLASLIVYNLLSITEIPLKFLIGDFHQIAFYILCVITGAALSLPNPRNRKLHRLLFLLRLALYPFSLYFCLVFLPYLPVSVLLIALFGSGILMLSPMGLILAHTIRLSEDFRDLQTGSLIQKAATLVLCGLLLPLGVYLNFRYQRGVLHTALDYVYAHSYNNPTCRVAPGALKKVLQALEDRDNELQTPYLSSVYNAIVFDNLNLAESRRKALAHIFLDEDPASSPSWVTLEEENEFELKKLDHESHYDRAGGYWISTLDLGLLNLGGFLNEYITTFTLPAGAFVSEYYLEMDGIRKTGQIAEKKAALWVYRQILTTSRDPGLLYYNDDGSLSLHVYPFNPGETRYTGLEIIHPEPFTLKLEDREITLGSAPGNPAQSRRVAADLYYISSTEKNQLPAAARQPVYHFILDCSRDASPKPEATELLIEGFLEKQKIPASAARVHLANYSYTSFDYTADWQSELARLKPQGGFFLERVAGNILLDHYTAATYPVMIILSSKPRSAVLPPSFLRLSDLVPEAESIYHLEENGGLRAYYPATDEAHEQGQTISAPLPPPQIVVKDIPGEHDIYLKADGEPELVYLPEEHQSAEKKPATGKWDKGARLWSLWQASNLNPAQTGQLFRESFKMSLQEGILGPWTSFIVLENKAQELALQRKQQQTLKGKEYLEAEKGQVSMSEPGLLVFLAACILSFFYRKKRA